MVVVVAEAAEAEAEAEAAEAEAVVVEAALPSAPQRGSLKAFVALGAQMYTIQLPLDGVESWAQLNQTIHESCEKNATVPDLPARATMHIVLNVNGVTVPASGRTPLDELWRAKVLKVSITDEGEGKAQPSLIGLP